MIMPQAVETHVLESLYRYHGGSVGRSVFSLLYIWVLFNNKLRGASKIKLEKVNKKRTVRVRRVIIFLNILRHPLLTWLHCCFHQYKTLKAVAMAKATIVLLTPPRNLNKVFWGFLVVFPLFNHFLGYVEIYQRVIWPKKIDFETFERL